MEIKLKEIQIREVIQNYKDNADEGVVGYDGKLNIRPPYQREFIYKQKERDAVINTIQHGFPLNVMYWVLSGNDNYEVLDGQQRIISFCQYVNGDFPIEERAFYNLTHVEREKILDYRLMVYFCDGTDKEKLDWFQIINIAGVKLTDQEIRNAIYSGSWLTRAKIIFSKPNCAAHKIAKDYINGELNRQAFLETAIKWISSDKIENYMSLHQHDPNADELWTYFQNVINWVKLKFTNYRKELKGQDWGTLYDKYHMEMLDSETLEREIKKLMEDDDVVNKRGIYPYVLTRTEKYLNIRAFTDSQKRTVYERQKGKCNVCNDYFDFSLIEADHITPWIDGGKTIIENCQILCKECNRRKSNK